MPIYDLQQQLRLLGRIRTGQQVPAAGGKTRPTKLDTFRLTTSSDRELIDHAAAVYGGIPTPWRDGWEVITGTNALDIIIPPGQMLSQWRELWAAGGCLRRCDGVTEQISGKPCLCPRDPKERRAAAAAEPPAACRETTRLSVMLPALPDLGVWMLESHGYYAAVELGGAAAVLAAATERRMLLPAKLVLEQRSRKIPGQPDHKYAVPVIRFGVAMGQVVGELAGVEMAPQIGPGAGVPLLPSTTLPATSDLRAPGDEPLELDREELVERLNREGIPLPWALERAQAIYGRSSLTALERGELFVTLRREALG